MILKNESYDYLRNSLAKSSKKIIVYGAGMIGQVIIPYIVQKYGFYDILECFVDMDNHKKGRKIRIYGKDYEIKTVDYLENLDSNHVILITNSKFTPVIELLDNIPGLDDMEGYIIPLMQIYELEHSDSVAINRHTEKQMIPKKIHYCWFGGKALPTFLRKCMNSWNEQCPDYEITEWNEHNYDINRHTYTREAYANGKYGFVADAARLDILYEHGGIYLDTDVMLLRNLDHLLFQSGFIGTEKWGNVNSGGGCGFIAGHPMLKKIIEYRDQLHFVLEDGSFNIETNGLYETKLFLEMGFKPDNTLQSIGDVTIYPSCIHHPYDYMSCEMHETDSTVSVHHFYGSWMEGTDKLNRKTTQEQYKAILARINSGGKPGHSYNPKSNT